MKLVLEKLGLVDLLTIKRNLIDVVKNIKDSYYRHNESGGCSFGMIILDRENFNDLESLDKIIKSLREEITENRIPHMPKIVTLCDMISLNDVTEKSHKGADYQL